MRALTIALCLLVAPALADVAGIPNVIDGDTIEVYGQRIRFHGIDAPESRQLCRLDGKPWQCGKDAANALADKIARRPVTCEDMGRDPYKRIIARCTVAGEDIESWMVSQGWALTYRRYSLDYVDEEAARAARCGIWASEFEKPWKWRRGKRLGANDNTPGQCRIKGNINRKGERIYIVFQARGHMWMRGSQGLLVDPQRALVERLGLRVVALGGSNRAATPFAPRYKALVTAPQFAR